jgi:hypothetical protein
MRRDIAEWLMVIVSLASILFSLFYTYQNLGVL